MTSSLYIPSFQRIPLKILCLILCHHNELYGTSILKELPILEDCGRQKFTFEEFNTLLCQVEACMNSRPLLPLNTHSDDGIEVLTPGHFIIGRSLQTLPSLDLTSQRLPLLKQWSLCQALLQHWWQRWSKEYL